MNGPPILVVEDSDDDFETVEHAIRAAGLQNPLHRATSGGMGLELLRGQVGTPLRPAFVLLDLNTPGVDGREALREIRADARLRSLPVVVLTTSANPRDIDDCYRAGANAFHVKPVAHGDHLQVVQAVFTYWLGEPKLPGDDQESP